MPSSSAYYAPVDKAYNNILTGETELSAFPRLNPLAFRGSYQDWGNNTLYRDDEISVPVYFRNFDKPPLPSFEGAKSPA